MGLSHQGKWIQDIVGYYFAPIQSLVPLKLSATVPFLISELVRFGVLRFREAESWVLGEAGTVKISRLPADLYLQPVQGLLP